MTLHDFTFRKGIIISLHGVTNDYPIKHFVRNNVCDGYGISDPNNSLLYLWNHHFGWTLDYETVEWRDKIKRENSTSHHDYFTVFETSTYLHPNLRLKVTDGVIGTPKEDMELSTHLYYIDISTDYTKDRVSRFVQHYQS